MGWAERHCGRAARDGLGRGGVDGAGRPLVGLVAPGLGLPDLGGGRVAILARLRPGRPVLGLVVIVIIIIMAAASHGERREGGECEDGGLHCDGEGEGGGVYVWYYLYVGEVYIRDGMKNSERVVKR